MADTQADKVKTINYKAGEGSGTMASETVNVGSKWVVPACRFKAPANKKFDHWEYSSAGDSNKKSCKPGDQIDIGTEGTLEVTAIYVDMIKVVSFNSNGGKGSMTDVNAPLGKYTLPASTFTAPSDKEFAYWAEDANDSNESKRHNVGDEVTFGAEGAVTFYAIWKAKTVSADIDTEEEKVLLYSATTEIDDLGFANPTKENKEFCVDFVAKADPKTYTDDVVKTVKANM